MVSRFGLILVLGLWTLSAAAVRAQHPHAGEPMRSGVLGAPPPIAYQPMLAPGTPVEWTLPAGPAPAESHGAPHEFRLPKGCATLQFMGGAYFKSEVGPTVPEFDFAPASIRLGRLLNFPCHLGGSFEPIVEITGAYVFNGFGSYLVGTGGLLRYNFVPADSCMIPYTQIGGGFLYNDAYRDPTQRALGQAIEFYLQAQVGLRLFIRPHLSLDVEAGYLHISNGNMADRNLGVNAFGGSFGLTYYFSGCDRR